MVTIQNTIIINRSIQAVFDIATTTKYWPVWHPQSLKVKGSIEHPIQLNERASEIVALLGQKRWVEWTCTSRDAPYYLKLEAKSKGIRSEIEYKFKTVEGGTQFTRHLFYCFHPLLKPLELLSNNTMRRNQKISMDNMKELLLREINI